MEKFKEFLLKLHPEFKIIYECPAGGCKVCVYGDKFYRDGYDGTFIGSFLINKERTVFFEVVYALRKCGQLTSTFYSTETEAHEAMLNSCPTYSMHPCAQPSFEINTVYRKLDIELD